MRIYLDACCLSRLTDNQSQSRIMEEAAAVEQILAGVRCGSVELVSGEILEEEVRRNPSLARRVEADAFLSLASARVIIDDAIALRANGLAQLGYGPFDALHIAAAESGADVLLTTDDRLLSRASRHLGSLRIAVQNPVSWIKEQEL